MNYLQAERLKWKRSVSNKLLVIVPAFTAVFAWIAGGFFGYQSMAFYWWYAFLLPGTIAIFCGLSHRREQRAGKYDSVLSMPVNLARFELARALVLVGKLAAAGLVLAVLVSVNNLISPATTVYSLGQSAAGSLALVMASIWQVPMCLLLARKTGFLVPVAVNTALGILLPVALGNTAFWFFCPWCWTAKLAEPLLGIALNGTYMGTTGMGTGSGAGSGENGGLLVTVPADLAASGGMDLLSAILRLFLPLFLSMVLFAALAAADAKDFSGKEGV